MLTAMDAVPDQFRILQEHWFATLWNFSSDLFFMLATLEIGLACLLWVMQREGVEHLGVGLLRKFLWFGFMYAVLLRADVWIPAIFRSFMIAGQQAANVETLSPSEVFTSGLGIGLEMLNEMRTWGIMFNLTGLISGLFAAFIVILAFGIIAIELAITLIESYIMVGAGVFLLGFAAFRGTASISERYLSFTIGVGLKLFVLYLLIGAGTTLAPMWAELITDTTMLDYKVPFTIAFSALMYATVCWRIPQLAGALASGTVAMGFHDVMSASVAATHIAANTAGAAVVGPGAVKAAAQLGQATSVNSGGGLIGALKGGWAAGSALTQETAKIAVPRLARVQDNIEEKKL